MLSGVESSLPGLTVFACSYDLTNTEIVSSPGHPLFSVIHMDVCKIDSWEYSLVKHDLCIYVDLDLHIHVAECPISV